LVVVRLLVLVVLKVSKALAVRTMAVVAVPTARHLCFSTLGIWESGRIRWLGLFWGK
jgi:hypothetical protein